MAATTLTDRAIVRVSGEGAREFLQGLVTNDLAGPLPAWAGLLTPQGKCLFDFFVWPGNEDSGEDFLIDCEAEAADDLVKRLAIYRLRRPIRIERDDGLADHWSPDEGEGVPDPRLAALGRRWIEPNPPRNGEGDHAQHGGGAPARYREHRLRLGVTEGRAELGDLLWLECNAAELNGVSFTKGCFVGQENTARMSWRQKINRRLVVVPASEPGPRTRVLYEQLGLAVEHRRTDDLDGALLPAWLGAAVVAPQDAG
jgi:folate-binding protein YgfZ